MPLRLLPSLRTRALPAQRASVTWALVPVALAAAAYVNALRNPFVWDDMTEVVENPSIRHLGDLRGLVLYSVTRPITNLSYAIDFAIWGDNPFGYHLTNLLLHTLNVALLFTMVRRFVDTLDEQRAQHLRSDFAVATAFAAASLFAVHPLLTEAVGYVSGRAEVLCATFVLGSVLCFLRASRKGGWAPLVTGTALFALALATKETAVVVPAILLAYDAWVAPPTAGRARFRRAHVALAALVVVAGVARVWLYIAVEHATAAPASWRNALVNVEVTARYLSLLVLPTSQTIVHDIAPVRSLYEPELMTAVAALVVVGAGIVTAARRSPLVWLGTVWFVVGLIPSAALILLAERGQPMAEHRVYLASCGFFIAVAAFGTALLRDTANVVSYRKPAAVFAVVVSTLFVLTVMRNRVWADPILLWSDAAQKAPRTWATQYGVGQAYRAIGDCEAAQGPYARAIALRPENVDAYLGLAECLTDLDRLDDARRVLRAGIARVPSEVNARLALAEMEEGRGNAAEALRLCREALALVPSSTDAVACVRRTEGTSGN